MTSKLKKLPYLIQGGLVSLLISFLVFIVLFIVGEKCSTGGYFTLPCWILMLEPGILIVGTLNKIWVIILSVIFYFLIGIIITFLLKKKKNQK